MKTNSTKVQLTFNFMKNFAEYEKSKLGYTAINFYKLTM